MLLACVLCVVVGIPASLRLGIPSRGIAGRARAST
jgi:hypothetical protein